MKRSEITVAFIQQILNLESNEKNIELSKETKLASLWAGYGEVNSLTVTAASKKIPLVIKRVNPPGSSTHNSSVSNQRKIKSYHIEAYFYKKIAPSILKLNEDGVLSCPIAIPYSIEKKEGKKEGWSPSFTFVLSDLSQEYNECSSYPGLDVDQTVQAIAWLAAFHAIFYNHESISISSEKNPSSDTDADADAEIWEEGGYWHLKTRLDELAEIPSNRRMFQNSAYAIDERMGANPDSLTLVHGDFKEANILFGGEQGPDYGCGCGCAAVDFQYCGRGYGVKDLVMLIVSSVSGRVLHELGGEDGLLRLYSNELKNNLVAIGNMDHDDIEMKASFEVLKMQYELALVDYVRFMAGWGMWGTNSDYAENRSLEILEDVASSWSSNHNRGNVSLKSLSEADWKEAINEKYPLELF